MAQDSAVDEFRLLDQLEAGIAVMNAAGIVVRWNANAERILGIRAEHAIGRPWAELAVVVTGTDIEGSDVRKAAMRPAGWHGLALLRLEATREVWVRAHVQGAKLDAGDETPGVVALFWPDAAPPAAATGDPALEERARTGGIILEQMAEAIVTTDPDMRITSFNPAAERLYGISSSVAMGRHADELLIQLDLDGALLDRAALMVARNTGFWHGRVIHRVRIGPFAGRHLVVDASITTTRDRDGRITGLLGMSKQAPADASPESQVEALASLAMAIGRSRSRRDVAEAALEQLCELTSSDFGVIASWADKHQVIEASLGFSEGTLDLIRSADIPGLGAIIDQPGTIVAVETIWHHLDGTDLPQALLGDGIATGFIVDLRARDHSTGFLALASSRPGWARPADETILQVAAQIANAVENARLMERLEEGLAQERRLTTQLETLMSLTLLPQGNVSEAVIAGALLERIMGALEANIGFVVHETDDRFQVIAGRRLPDAMKEMVETRPADSFDFWRRLSKARNGGAFQETFVEAARSEPGVDEMIHSGVTGHAVFPVREGSRVTGAFLCYFTSSPEAPAVQTDDRNVEAVGRIISIAYENARMSEGLAEAAEHERRLTAELRALQELTLLGASTDDLTRLAQETIDEVVLATGASGGGYVLVDPNRATVDPIASVGLLSGSWARGPELPLVPAEWPSLSDFEAGDGIWLSAVTDGEDGKSQQSRSGALASARRRPARRRHLPRVVRLAAQRRVRPPLPRADRPGLQHFAGQLPAALRVARPCRGPAGPEPQTRNARRANTHRRRGQFVRGTGPPNREPGSRGARRRRCVLPAYRTGPPLRNPRRRGRDRCVPSLAEGRPREGLSGRQPAPGRWDERYGRFRGRPGQRACPASRPGHRFPFLRRHPYSYRRGTGRRASVLLRIARGNAATGRVGPRLSGQDRRHRPRQLPPARAARFVRGAVPDTIRGIARRAARHRPRRNGPRRQRGRRPALPRQPRRSPRPVLRPARHGRRTRDGQAPPDRLGPGSRHVQGSRSPAGHDRIPDRGRGPGR